MNDIPSDANLAARILIVDVDEGARGLVAALLGGHGYHVDTASDPAATRAALERRRYDLIVLDVTTPCEDGLAALRELLRDAVAPVLAMSADRVVGRAIGADDFVAKPCDPRELLESVRTVLRRAARPARDRPTPPGAPQAGDDGLRFAGWRMDLAGRTLHDAADRIVALSDGEFRLLRAFAQHPGHVLTRDELLNHARGPRIDTFDRAIDVQISRLRRKLASGDTPTELIRTVRGEGYLFVPAVTHG